MYRQSLQIHITATPEFSYAIKLGEAEVPQFVCAELLPSRNVHLRRPPRPLALRYLSSGQRVGPRTVIPEVGAKRPLAEVTGSQGRATRPVPLD